MDRVQPVPRDAEEYTHCTLGTRSIPNQTAMSAGTPIERSEIVSSEPELARSRRMIVEKTAAMVV
jgi:hypothetical protein